MEWNHIRSFLTMAETGSLLKAAKMLKVSQPTLSRHLTALEEDLGTTVFTRRTTGLELTAAGEELMVHARHMADDALAIERVVVGTDFKLSGSVTISAVASIGNEWLPVKLYDFHEKYPDIELTVRTEDTSADLMRKEADIAIRMYRPVQPDLIAKKVGRSSFGFYTTQKYIDKHGRPETRADLKDHNMILPVESYDDFVRPVLDKLGIKLGSRVFTSNSAAAQMQAMLSGYGIGITNSIPASLHPELISLFPDSQRVNDIWLVTHQDIRRGARIRAVYDYLSDLFAEYRRDVTEKSL